MKKIYITALIFILCFLTIEILSDRYYYGNWYFPLMIVLYSLGILSGISCIILNVIKFKQNPSFSQLSYFFFCLLVTPILLLNSVNYYKDLHHGVIELETELYKIPIESFYEENPDIPKRIDLFYNGCHWLMLNDGLYFELINNNPVDRTRTVYDSAFDEETNPHLHPIRIKFHPYTQIIDEIQILYER